MNLYGFDGKVPVNGNNTYTDRENRFECKPAYLLLMIVVTTRYEVDGVSKHRETCYSGRRKKAHYTYLPPFLLWSFEFSFWSAASTMSGSSAGSVGAWII